MKIAYLINQYPAPSHSFIRREIRALEALGVEVERFTLREFSGLVDGADLAERARTRALLKARSPRLFLAVIGAAARRPLAFCEALWVALRLGWRSDRGVLRHLAYLAEACLLAKWLAHSGAQHLHAHFGTNPATVAMLCRVIGGLPYSFTVHGPEEFDRPRQLGLEEKIRRATFVVAVSDFGRSQLCRWSRYSDWSKLAVLRCGVDESLLRVSPIPVPALPHLVCVARLGEQKGHPVLIEALARLSAQGTECKVVLVGDGPLRPALESLARRLGVADKVKFAGWLSEQEVRAEIHRSRALVLPSFAEGLPVVIMEALALARPVISTWVAGIPELVEHDVCGWLMPAGSVEKLVDAMRAALEASPDRLEAMGTAGSARVARLHDASIQAKELADLFRASIEEASVVPAAAGPSTAGVARANPARFGSGK